MRKITEESVDAFMNARRFKKSNMEVEVRPNVTILKLHGNDIAYRYNDPEGTLSITNCGWFSNVCLLYTSPSPRDLSTSRMPSSA